MVSRNLLHNLNIIFQIECMLLCSYMILSGWGTVQIIEPTEEFAYYANLFETYGKQYKDPNYKLPPMRISFANLQQSVYNGFNRKEVNTIGICLPDGNGKRHILIDKEFWDGAEPREKELLIFHELAHCVLGRGHDSRMFCSNVEYSIMHPTLIHGFDYENKKEHYLRDLFNSTYSDNVLDVLLNKAPPSISCMPEMTFI